MRLCVRERLFRARVLTAMLALASVAWCETSEDCDRGKEPLFLYCSPELDRRTHEGLAEAIEAGLYLSLDEIGYCVVPTENPAACRSDSALAGSLLLYVTVADPAVLEEQRPALIAALVKPGPYSRENLEIALSRPLVALSFDSTETDAARAAFIKKVVESLRVSYVCHFVVQSEPQGVSVATSNGLEGTTPTEWILPLGRIELFATMDGYASFRRALELDTPGRHEFFFQMRKKRFYHSKFTMGTVAGLVAAGVCYSLEWHFYKKYHSLDNEDRIEHPDRFAQTFGTAQAFGCAGAASLGVAGACLMLSFWF